MILKKLKINEDVRFVCIYGVKNINIHDAGSLLKNIEIISNKYNTEIQLLDADSIATWEHVFFSAMHALKAFVQKRNVSKTISMESLLYASCQRQIDIGIKKLGIDKNSKNIAVLIIGNIVKNIENAKEDISSLIEAEEEDIILDIQDNNKFEKLCDLYNISNNELSAFGIKERQMDNKSFLVKIILEKSALLAIS